MVKRCRCICLREHPWAAVFCLLLIGVLIAAVNCRADVIVLANRTPAQLPVRFVPAAGQAQQLTLQAGETMPLFLDGKGDVFFASREGPKHYTLDANCAYYFGRANDGRVDLEKIGLGEDGTAAEGRKITGTAVQP